MLLYLASRSPRRQQLLEQIGTTFTPLAIDIDEHWDGDERAVSYVVRMAQEKARAGFESLKQRKDAIVLGADTAVVVDDEVLGKAETTDQAAAMLRRLSGRMHHVISAVAVVSEKHNQHYHSRTVVCFRPLPAAEIAAYCASGEAVGKAGGYAIQGRAAVFVESIQGSYSGVVGLPLYETWQLLAPLLPQPPAPERRQ